MRRVRLPLALVAGSVALAGCGGQQASSTDRFQGAEREIAQLVEDLQSEGQKGDGAEICSRIVSAELARSIAAGGGECKDEMSKALSDANDFDLDVREVTVTGTTATAQVRQGEDGRTATFEFARGPGGWRATSLAGS